MLFRFLSAYLVLFFFFFFMFNGFASSFVFKYTLFTHGQCVFNNMHCHSDRMIPGCFIPLINPYLTNGFSHRYQLGESTFIFRGVRSDFYFFSISFFDEISSLCKQNSLRWDAAFCGVISGAILFAYVPQKGGSYVLICTTFGTLSIRLSIIAFTIRLASSCRT